MSLRLVSVLFLAVVALAVAECAQIFGVLLFFAPMVGSGRGPPMHDEALAWIIGCGSHRIRRPGGGNLHRRFRGDASIIEVGAGATWTARSVVGSYSNYSDQGSAERHVEALRETFLRMPARSTIRQVGSFTWVARMRRSDSGSLIIEVWAPFRKSSYSRAIAGDTTSINNRFSSQNSMTWKNGL